MKAKEKYVFPTIKTNWKELTEKELGDIFRQSEKKNLAVSLAMEIGLGGLYAEEICKLAGIDKNLMPQAVDKKNIALIIKTIKVVQNSLVHPQGFIYEEEITPFPLAGLKEKQRTKTYNEAVNTLNPFVVVSPYDQKIKEAERIMAQQQEAIQKQEELIELNSKKGELIYERYQPLHKLLEIVKELKKIKEWAEIASELKKEKKIKSVDLKNKKVIIEL